MILLLLSVNELFPAPMIHFTFLINYQRQNKHISSLWLRSYKYYIDTFSPRDHFLASYWMKIHASLSLIGLLQHCFMGEESWTLKQDLLGVKYSRPRHQQLNYDILNISRLQTSSNEAEGRRLSVRIFKILFNSGLRGCYHLSILFSLTRSKVDFDINEIQT